jgi:RHS repeat-associated protein
MLIMRDSEKNFSWLGDGDVLDQRTFYVQNWPSLWRADVVAVLDSIGQPIEEVRSTAYGTPSVHPMADVNHDGLVNATDVSVWAQIQGGNALTGVWLNDDLNRDELFPTDVADDDFFFDRHASSAGGSYGFHRLSSIGNRLGYAGYVWDATSRVWHVRHRVLESESGKWTRMDPLGYVDGSSVVQYTRSQPTFFVDSHGFFATSIIAVTEAAFADALEEDVSLYTFNTSSDNDAPYVVAGGLTSIDGAISACMRKPTVSRRAACLEGLLGLFPGNPKFDAMIRAMIKRMKEAVKEQHLKKIKWQDKRLGRCSALHTAYKGACAGCEGCQKRNEDCEFAAAMTACWAACVAGRAAYDKSGCPVPAGHKTAANDNLQAMFQCKANLFQPHCRGQLSSE